MTDTTASRVADLADTYWQSWLEAHPVEATSIGDRRYDDRVEDPSPAGIAARRLSLVGLLDQTAAVDPDGLDETDRVTHAALIEEITSELARIDAGLEDWTIDPLEGPPVHVLGIESYQLVGSVEEGRAMVARWERIGPWLDQHAANLRRGLAAGRVAVRTPLEKVASGIRDTLAVRPRELPLLAPARVDHADWSPADLDAFRAGLAAAVRDSIRPALERYLAVVEDELLPAARPDERPGIGQIDGGAEAYAGLIRVHTSLDLAAEEIHRIGLAEIERIDAELAELGARVLGARDMPDVLERLRTDRSLHFSTGDEVFAKANSALARAREAIPDWFGTLPQAECEVVRMPQHEEKHSTIAYYRQPATDGSRPGQFYVNTWAPETRPRYEAEALAYHESIPGHHLQIAIGQELTGVPEFRRHVGPTSYFEGWGLYTERLSDEMGLYSGDLDRIGILSFDGWRACRLVVDTGMHALGWTRGQAIEFMSRHSALARNNIENEVDRYIVWPGQALAYKLGQLEILRLRDEARERQGERFDIRAFHDAVLQQGALGLQALRTVVERRLAAGGPPSAGI